MADDDKRMSSGFSKLLGGMTDFLDKMEKLAETGAEVQREGRTPEGRGAYRVSMKVGGLGDPGGQGYKVEPVAKPRRDRDAAQPPLDEAREPLVDVFDEGERLVIVAEMPGVEPEDVHVDLTGRALTLNAERADRKYHKSIEVPEGIRRDGLSVSSRNGIIQISAAKPRA